MLPGLQKFDVQIYRAETHRTYSATVYTGRFVGRQSFYRPDNVDKNNVVIKPIDMQYALTGRHVGYAHVNRLCKCNGVFR